MKNEFRASDFRPPADEQEKPPPPPADPHQEVFNTATLKWVKIINRI